MKKVLIITYYWPPSGGVQRWLKFVKYLPSQGCKPIVVVPDNPEYPVIDSSLEAEIPEEAEIIKLPIWEPYWILKKITGRKKGERVNNGLLFDGKTQTLTERISLWIRGNFLIPDPRLFWINSSVKKLKKIIPGLQPDIIITTGPPHSVHLIGYQLKKMLGVPWIADLRDPWANIDILDKFYPTKLARKRHKRMERKVLSLANQIITVSPSWAEELEKIINKPVKCITNGFDGADFSSKNKTLTNGFTISYVGMINSFRNHRIFWESLDELCAASDDFRKNLTVRVIGIYDKRLIEELERFNNLKGRLQFLGYVHHSEVKEIYAESHCLLLFQNRSKNAKGHIPGKLFEYLASGKPILALANPASDTGKIITDCRAGMVCDFDDKEAIKKAVLAIFKNEIKNPVSKKIEQYSRKSLTAELGAFIQKTINRSDFRLRQETIPEKKRVLIITYYWPPSGGGGVMRWLKMSKFLPEFGWQPIIYTPSNPDSSVYDFSLVDEIHPEIIEIKTPIWEPYSIYRRITGKGENTHFKAGYISEASTGSWKGKLSVFIRGNFLIPDPRRFWIRPSIKYLSRFLKKNKIDVIISTGPPHSTHLIALGLKRKFDIQWIADFRDPWTNIDFYNKLRLTKRADKKHHRLERTVLTLADHVVTVSPGCATDLSKVKSKKVDVIYNGYDPHDFEDEVSYLDTDFTITHFGAFNKDRNPFSLWTAMNKLVTENPDFKKHLRIQLIGQTDDTIIKEIEKNNLAENLILINHLPHKEGLMLLGKSQVLLLPLNDAPNVKGILPGKMYEYLALKRPILAIGPIDADFTKIISETHSGVAHGFQDEQGIKKSLEKYFTLYSEGNLKIKSSSFEKYSRRNLARQFMNLVEK